MSKPIVTVWNRPDFENNDISEFQFAVSICEHDERNKIVRPDYNGQRLNLWFWDKIDGDGIATEEDIDKLYEFSKKWLDVTRSDTFLARMIVHCSAGISRSSACAMMPLSLWYGSYQGAAKHLFMQYPYVNPNSHILSLIGERTCFDQNIHSEVNTEKAAAAHPICSLPF
jgi:predicted protein tyrosine phosphatase